MIAEHAGLLYVEDRCLIIEKRLRLNARAPGSQVRGVAATDA